MKRLIKKSTHSYTCRDEALLYINGEILIGNNHPDLINEYLTKYDTELLNKLIEEYSISHPDIPEEEIGWETVMQFSEYERIKSEFKSIDDIGLAFGHIIYEEVNNETDEEYDIAIYLETGSITNISIDEVINAIKIDFPDSPIFNDDSYPDNGGFADKYERIAKNKLI